MMTGLRCMFCQLVNLSSLPSFSICVIVGLSAFAAFVKIRLENLKDMQHVLQKNLCSLLVNRW